MRNKLLPVSWGAHKQLRTASHFVILLARTKNDMVASGSHIQHMMRDVQQLPTEVMKRKEDVYHQFLESDFALLGNERAMFEWASR
jgi:hypothetical protein